MRGGALRGRRQKPCAQAQFFRSADARFASAKKARDKLRVGMEAEHSGQFKDGRPAFRAASFSVAVSPAQEPVRWRHRGRRRLSCALACSTVSIRLCIKLVTASSSSSNLDNMWLCLQRHASQQRAPARGGKSAPAARAAPRTSPRRAAEA